MLAVASAKAPEVELFVADVRDAGPCGRVRPDHLPGRLVNYLTGDGDLEAAFGSFERNLAADGVLVFDLNTVSTYRTTFARDMTLEGPERVPGLARASDGDEGPSGAGSRS